MMNKGQPIGIDFGTTKTLACRWDTRSQRPVPIRMGRRMDLIPTSIHLDEDGNYAFGDDAEDMRVSDAAGYVTRIKRDLERNASRALRNGHRETPVGLVAKFLEHIREQIEKEALHGPVGHVVITVPALSGPAMRANLKMAVTLAGIRDFELLEEPVAGGLAFLHDNSDSVPGRNFLVFDWGGGTLDLAVVQRDGENLRPLPNLIDGHPMLGGEDIDDSIQDGVSGILEGHGRKRLHEQPDENFVSALRTLTDGKILLSRKPTHKFRLNLSDGPFEFAWKVEEFEEFIANPVNQAISLAMRLVKKANHESVQLDGVVLIGGSSEIPLIARRIEEVTGLKTLKYDHGKEAVAMGATLQAQKKTALVGTPLNRYQNPPVPVPPLPVPPIILNRPATCAKAVLTACMSSPVPPIIPNRPATAPIPSTNANSDWVLPLVLFGAAVIGIGVIIYSYFGFRGLLFVIGVIIALNGSGRR